MSPIIGITLLCILSSTVKANPVNLPDKWNVSWTNLEETLLYSEEEISKDIFVGETGHSLAYLTWNDDSNDPTSYNLTVITHTYDKKTLIKICNFSVPINKDPEEITINLEGIEILNANRVLVQWIEKHESEDERTEFTDYEVILMDKCQSSGLNSIRSGDTDFVKYRNNTFDIIYRGMICPGHHFCKSTYDFDGKLIHKNTPEVYVDMITKEDRMTKIDDIFTITHGSNEELVFLGKKVNEIKKSEPEFGIYSPLNGWNEIEYENLKYTGYSNSNGFASFCWLEFIANDIFIHCQSLDGARGNKAVKVPTQRLNHDVGQLDIYHKPNGHLLLLKTHGRGFTIDEMFEDGRCKRIYKDTRFTPNVRIQISTSDKDQYCFSFLEKDYIDPNSFSKKNFWYKFSMTCSKVLDHVDVKDYIQCGKRLTKEEY